MRLLAIFLTAALLSICSCSAASGNPDYDKYFTGERLRLDFMLAGDDVNLDAFLVKVRKECEWAGSPNSLIDPFGYGELRFEAYSGETLVYSTGMCPLFLEWTTTAEASKVAKAMSNTVWMPFPKEEITVRLFRRQKADGSLKEIFSCSIDPKDALIERSPENSFEVVTLRKSGDNRHKVDLLYVAEGYTADEMDKFQTDCKRFTDYLFSMAPYKDRKDDFNVRAVLSVSEDSGTTIPNRDEWKNTVLKSNFYTFYTDRYLTVLDHSLIASAVSNAPFDAVFVIANESKYGGGGFYNSYGLGTADNELSEVVFVHEFGHSFAGLGDEYYTSEVAYEDYYNLKLEPWEPNITTLVDFGSKWKDMKDSGKAGLFEGGGYMAKGIYRPAEDCRMKSNTPPDFCPVCQRAISRMIDFYCK